MQRKSLYLSKEMFDIEIFTIEDHFKLTESFHCGVPKVDIFDIIDAYKWLTDLQENKNILRDLQEELWSHVKPSHVCIFGILVNKQTHKLGWILMCAEAVDLSIENDQKPMVDLPDGVIAITTKFPDFIQTVNPGFRLADFDQPPYKDILAIVVHNFLQFGASKCTLGFDHTPMHKAYESMLMEEHKNPTYSIHNHPHTFCRKFYISCANLLTCVETEEGIDELAELQVQHVFSTTLIYKVQLPTDIANKRYTCGLNKCIPVFPVSDIVLATRWEIEDFVKKHLSEEQPTNTDKGFWICGIDQYQETIEKEYTRKNIYGAIFVNASPQSS